MRPMSHDRLAWVRPGGKAVAVATLTGVAALAMLLVRPIALGDPSAVVNGHADLLASVPAEGDTLSASPPLLRLAFAEAVDPAFSSIDLVRADGVSILDHAGVPDPVDGRILETQVPDLQGGVYQVRWRTLSSGDGHAAFGSYAFRFVAPAAGSPAASPSIGGSSSGPARAALPASTGSVDQVARVGHGGHGDTLGRTLGYLGTMLAFGLGAFAWLVVRPTLRRIPERLARLSAVALLVAAVGGVLQGVLEAGDVAQATVGPFDPIRFAVASEAGRRLLLRIVLSLLLAAGVWRLGRSRPGAAVVLGTMGGAVGIVLIALSSHAAGSGSVAAVDLIHLAAASVWLAGILTLAMTMVGRRGKRLPRRLLAAAIPRFTALALTAVAIIAASGVLQAWQEGGDLLPAGDTYGRTLILKVAIFLVAIGFGAANMLDAGRGKRWLGGTRDRLAFEAYAAAFVVVAAALLAADTPSGLVRPVALAPIPSAAASVASDHAAEGIGLGLRPARPGPNHYVVSVPHAYPEGASVTIAFIPADTTVGLTAAPPPPTSLRLAVTLGSNAVSYVGDGDQLAPATAWQINVVVRDGAGALTARRRFGVVLGADSLQSGQLGVSVDPSAILAGLLVVLGASAVALGFRGRRLPRADRAASRWAFIAGGSLGAVLGLAALALPR